jgi:phosphoglycerol transferase MdoB-like AlkP superfamily enzyme
MFNRIPPIILVLLCLAAFGFLWRFVQNPVHTLLVIGMSALLCYFVYNFFKTGRFLPRSGHTQAKTAKQSAKNTKTPAAKKGKAARKHIPFQVIEGNKGKTKNKPNDNDSNISR